MSQYREFLHSVSIIEGLVFSGTCPVKKEMLFLMLGAFNTGKSCPKILKHGHCCQYLFY
jgi:hypothetical protein